MRTHGFAARQFPRTRLIAEWFRRQCTDRAQIDHVARQLRIDGAAEEAGDFCMFAAMQHSQFHHTTDFLPEAHTAGAVDAAAHFFHRNQRPDILVEHDALFFGIARFARAIADRDILQQAFATLIADRAIERMVDQQEFHHRLLRRHSPFAVGVHHHAGSNWRRAGRYRPRHFFHLDHAHAATGSDRQLFVIAEMRDISAELFGSRDHRRARRHFDFLAVNFDLDHDRLHT